MADRPSGKTAGSSGSKAFSETSPGTPATDQVFWVHPASFTYRFDEPEQVLETVWIAHPGWGYLRRRDLWIRREGSVADLMAQGYLERKSLSHEEVSICPFCRMYICSIPGALVQKHFAKCGGNVEDWLKLEQEVIEDVRRKNYEKAVLEARMQELAEQEALERKERFERVREELAQRQLEKDRKKRLKEETRKELRNR